MTMSSSNQNTKIPENRSETETTSMNIIRISTSEIVNQTVQLTTLTEKPEIPSKTTLQTLTSTSYSTEMTSNATFTNQTVMSSMNTTPNLTTMINETDKTTMTSSTTTPKQPKPRTNPRPPIAPN